MRCPACGHDNSIVATRCASCGSMLSSIRTDDTVPQQIASEETAERPFVQMDTEASAEPPAAPPTEAPQPTVDRRPRLARLASLGRHSLRYVGTHQRGIALTIAVGVVGIIAIAWVILYLLDAPAYSQVESDLSGALSSYAYDGGAYGPDLNIPLSSITVTKRSSKRGPASSTASGAMSYDVEAEAAYDDGHLRVVRNVAAEYVRTQGEWVLTGDVREQGVSFSARAGVDEQKVLNNMADVLASASTSGTLLADVYAGGSFSIASNNFTESPDKDTSIDDVTIDCRREGTFYAYAGTVTAHFAFESGTWILRSAEANADATTRTYEPLVGTWYGTFASTTSTGAGNCYGASGHELVLSIDSVGSQDTGHGRVQGTVSAVAHYHEGTSKSESSSTGDEYLENVAFTGTIETTRGAGGNALSIECTTAGSAKGTVSFVLSFGTDEDPSAALAHMTSSYEYEDVLLMLIPFQVTDTFTDTYILTKA